MVAHSRLLAALLATLAAVMLLMPAAQAVTVYVPAKDEQCFHDDVTRNEKVVATYQVEDGGNLDIDMRVLGPDNKIVYEKERSQEGSLQFKATASGTHTICFDNRMSTVSGKTVAFNLYVGDALHKRDAASTKNLTPLESAIVKTAEGIQAMKDRVSYIRHRESRHAQTTDSTNKRVLLWNMINLGAVVAMAALQILMIRGFFETKRKV